jgi:hypothetical protein
MTASTGEPGTPETDPSTAAGGAPKPGTTEQPKTEPKTFKVEDLPADAQAFLRAQIADGEAKARTTSKANAAAEERSRLLKELSGVLGLEGGDKPTVEQLTAALAQTKAGETQVRRELDASKAIRKAGGDDEGMLDSSAFLAKLAKVDPASDSYKTDLEALVTAEIEANPRFKAKATTAPAAGGATGEFGGGSGSTTGAKPAAEMSVADMRSALYPTGK